MAKSPLQHLRLLYKQLLGWEGDSLDGVDFVMASYLSTYLPGAVERAWGDICAGAGTGKGELLRAVQAYSRTRVMHNVTENAFASGYRDDDNPEKDPSILNELKHDMAPKGPKVLVLPELTNFLAMKKEKVGKFFGDMRAAFDGEFTSHAGNVGRVAYGEIGFGLITACTEILDEFRKVNQTLGERTLVCRIARHLGNYKARRLLAQHVATTDRRAKAELREAIQATVEETFDAAIPAILSGQIKAVRTPDWNAKIATLGALATSIRTVPLGPESYTTSPEAPTRFTLQLQSWGDARALFDRRTAWNEGDFGLVRRVAQDTMPPENLALVRALYRGDPEEAVTEMKVEKLVTEVHQPRNAVVHQLRQWAQIGFATCYSTSTYGLHPDAVEDLHDINFLGANNG